MNIVSNVTTRSLLIQLIIIMIGLITCSTDLILHSIFTNDNGMLVNTCYH